MDRSNPTPIHPDPSPLAGKVVRIATDPEDELNGSEYVVEDWWDRVVGKSWMACDGNPACMDYAVRTGFRSNPPPTDNEVLYGKVGGFGKLVHINDIDKSSVPADE